MELWFKHGSGWHENQKLVNLIIETGYEGYGVYTVLLELLLSHGGSLELNYKKLNYIVRCQTELLKRVINQFGLFTVVTENDGRVMFYADWLLEDIRKAEKTSKVRSECGKKGAHSRYGAEKASELANTVGVPENESLTIANENVANAIANATENGSRIDKRDKIVSTINPNRINSTSKEKEEERARENFAEGSKKVDVDNSCKTITEHLPVMKADTEWLKCLLKVLASSGISATEEDVKTLLDHFCMQKVARGEESKLKTLADAKKWFCNWLMLNVKLKKKNGSDKSSVPARTDGGNVSSGRTGYRKSFAEQVRESKEKLLRDTARMLQNGELGSLGIGRELSRDLQS